MRNNKTRTSKKITTITDILAQDNINAVMEKAHNEKPEMANLIVIYIDRDGNTNWHISEDTKSSQAVYALEIVKNDILNENAEP